MNLPRAVGPEHARVSKANGSAGRGAVSGAVPVSDPVPDPFSALLAEVFRKSDILSNLTAKTEDSSGTNPGEKPGRPTRRSRLDNSTDDGRSPEGGGVLMSPGLCRGPDAVPTPELPGERPNETAGGGRLQGRASPGAGEVFPIKNSPGPEVSSQAEAEAADSSIPGSRMASSSVASSLTRAMGMGSDQEPAALRTDAEGISGQAGEEKDFDKDQASSLDPLDGPVESDSTLESMATEGAGSGGAAGDRTSEDAGTSESSGEGTAGTSSAEMEDAMLAETLMNKTSESGGQELPSASEFSVEAQLSESGANRESQGKSEVSEQAMATVTPGWTLDDRTDREVRVDSSVPADPGHAERVERLVGLAEAAVVRFRRMEGGEYEVSIRPDDATEIRLSVSLDNGAPEVRAELRRGDAAAFAAQWPDLQERLSQQGIRLMPNVATVGNPASSGGGPHEGPGRQNRQESVSNTFETRRAAPVTRDQTLHSMPSRISGGRGWETWA